MRNNKLNAQVPGAAQVHGGQDGKWAQLCFGRGGADLVRGAVRDGVQRCLPADRGSRGRTGTGLVK